MLFRPGSTTDVTCVAHENAPAVTSSDHKPVSAAFEISAGELQCAQFESARRVDIVDASTRMSHAGFGNVHGDIVDLATSGGAAPAFPPVEDDLRLPAQPKDVSDLRKGDVVAFDEAHLPGHEAFPCVKLKQLGAAVAKVLQRNVKASFYQGLSALADRLILRRPIVRCIVVVQDRILVVDTRGRPALNYGGTGTVKSNRHVSTFSHASYPRTKDRAFSSALSQSTEGELVPGRSIDGPAPGHPAAAGVLRGHVRPALRPTRRDLFAVSRHDLSLLTIFLISIDRRLSMTFWRADFRPSVAAARRFSVPLFSRSIFFGAVRALPLAQLHDARASSYCSRLRLLPRDEPLRDLVS